jgi:hypothetical protein
MSILNNDVRPATRVMVVIPVLVALLTLGMAAAVAGRHPAGDLGAAGGRRACG